jgi:hypothetical protein
VRLGEAEEWTLLLWERSGSGGGVWCVWGLGREALCSCTNGEGGGGAGEVTVRVRGGGGPGAPERPFSLAGGGSERGLLPVGGTRGELRWSALARCRRWGTDQLDRGH